MPSIQEILAFADSLGIIAHEEDQALTPKVKAHPVKDNPMRERLARIVRVI